jgi:DNA-binding response OmpR family regulator
VGEQLSGPPSESPAAPTFPPTPGFRALVAADEPALVRVVATYLAREGFDVVTAANGFEALHLGPEVEPDVVVLDLMMPGIDGLEVCRRLRTFTDAYVVMLTARAEEGDSLLGLSVGADVYLTKPFSPRVLVAGIRSLLRRPRGPGWYGDERLVDIHLGHVRRKPGDDAADARYVRTVRGVGYRMRPG